MLIIQQSVFFLDLCGGCCLFDVGVFGRECHEKKGGDKTMMMLSLVCTDHSTCKLSHDFDLLMAVLRNIRLKKLDFRLCL